MEISEDAAGLPRRRLGRSADARPARLAQVCSTVCNDHDESCKGWAKEGECEPNKAFMSRVCPGAGIPNTYDGTTSGWALSHAAIAAASSLA